MEMQRRHPELTALHNPMQRWHFGEFSVSVDPSTGRFVGLYRAQQAVPLGDTALRVLEVLVGRAPATVTGKTLCNDVWPVGANLTNVAHQIRNLRRALGDREPFQYIRTVGKQGYVFAKPLSQTTDPGSSSGLAQRQDKCSRSARRGWNRENCAGG
jgi:DNA-binding winged helix-turn-helix (wHTH) protein